MRKDGHIMRAPWTLIPSMVAILLVLAPPRPGVWLDEAATISAVSRSWGGLWHLVENQDRSLVGYYIATKILADLLGCAPLTAGRAISGGSYVAGVFLVTLIAARLWGGDLPWLQGLLWLFCLRRLLVQ